MSICTKTGDKGTTGLLYNRRVSKTHPRVEACGAIDELNAALGVARAAGGDASAGEKILAIQKELINLMGETATLLEDRQRYIADGYKILQESDAATIESWIHELEKQNISFKGWATPGGTLPAAHLDLARAICRRAERALQKLAEAGEIQNPVLLIYLNRVSDFLWLLARRDETLNG